MGAGTLTLQAVLGSTFRTGGVTIAANANGGGGQGQDDASGGGGGHAAGGAGGGSGTCGACREGCPIPGGAGGAVRLLVQATATVNTNRVIVSGAGGGAATCGSARGGAGSDGRIGVRASPVSGTTSPAFDTN